MPSRAILLGYKTRGWASSRIANPLSLKANLDPTGLANPVSNPQWGCPLPDSQPFRSRAHSFLGANRPIGPWPIRSLALSLPGTFAPLSEMAGPFAPGNDRSLELWFQELSLRWSRTLLCNMRLTAAWWLCRCCLPNVSNPFSTTSVTVYTMTWTSAWRHWWPT